MATVDHVTPVCKAIACAYMPVMAGRDEIEKIVKARIDILSDVQITHQLPFITFDLFV